MAIRGKSITVNSVDVFRAHLSDTCRHNPTSTWLDLGAYVAGIDPDTADTLDILAFLADNRDSDVEVDGFSLSVKIEALFTLQLQNMAGSVEANDREASQIEKRIYAAMNDGAAWNKAKLIESAQPDFDKDDPQQDADMDSAFAKLVKRKDIVKLGKDMLQTEGKGRWSFIQRVKAADTGK